MSNNLNLCKNSLEIDLLGTEKELDFGTALRKVIDTVSTWNKRVRQRQDLARLDSRLLRDVGLTKELAEAEIEKPFWAE